jgi:DNA (cytosine-5)-methyltransferase 1
MGKGPRGTEAVESGHVVTSVRDTSPTITSNYGKQIDSSDTSLGPNVVYSVETVGTLRTRRPGEGGVQGDFDHIVPVISPALNTQSGSHHAPDTKAYVAFTQNTRSEVRYINGDGQLAGALAAQSGMNQTNYVAYGMTTEQTPKFAEDMALTLTKQSPTGGGQPQAVMVSTSTVRRLTPTECERLQGFPDNFTAIPWRKKGAEDCPDGPRYKALGNSMAVPVMRWIGERIKLVDDFISVF